MLSKVPVKIVVVLIAVAAIYHKDLLAKAAFTCNPNAVYAANLFGDIYYLRGCTTNSKCTPTIIIWHSILF